MNSLAASFSKLLRLSSPHAPSSSLAVGVGKISRWRYSSERSDGENDDVKDDNLDGEYDEILGEKRETQPQGVDPKRGWGFRGVHKAIICGKVGQGPVQKILRNGRTVTILTVGTGGLFDQRIVVGKDTPKPAQWHRIVIHNQLLSAYAVQQIAKNSAVYVEGDIEIRVFNDALNGEVKTIPEICVRRDGRIRLIKAGESASKISLDELQRRKRNLYFTATTIPEHQSPLGAGGGQGLLGRDYFSVDAFGSLTDHSWRGEQLDL